MIRENLVDLDDYKNKEIEKSSSKTIELCSKEIIRDCFDISLKSCSIIIKRIR